MAYYSYTDMLNCIFILYIYIYIYIQNLVNISDGAYISYDIKEMESMDLGNSYFLAYVIIGPTFLCEDCLKYCKSHLERKLTVEEFIVSHYQFL